MLAFYYFYTVRSLAQCDGRTLATLLAATVESHKEMMAAAFHLKSDHRVVAQHDRTHAETVRRNGSERKYVGAGDDDRTANRKGVGGGTGGRADHKTIGLICG